MKDKPKPLDLDEFWKENFHNARRFFTSKGNLKTRIKLKNKWKKEFYNRIKSACEFYLRYKDNPNDLFINESWARCIQLDEFIQMLEDSTDRNEELTILDEYNEWLFRLAFKGVLRDGNRDNK